jgi:hypothetical protein
MNIDEENKAREFYIKSTIKGTHTPPNMVELNYLDLLKLMHSYAQEQVKNLGLFSVSGSLPSDEEFETALEKEAFRVPYDGSNNYYDEPTLKHWCKCWEWVKNAVSNSALQNNNKLIENMCISYRHDFGLMKEEQKNELRFQCKEWLRAYENNLDHCC